MICIGTYGSRRGIDGRAYVRAEIQADTVPDPMPRTGEGIDGLDDFAAIDIGSRLSVLDSSAVYVLGEDWTWYKWTEQSGGGGGEPGVTPNVQMTAGVTPGRDGDPYVDVERSGSDENPRFHAQFYNIQGLPGDNGQSAEIEVSDAEGGHTVTVRSAAGEESFFVKDGADGEDGGPGPAGESPTVEVSDDDGGHTVTIRYAGGTESFFVPDGRDGAPGETPSVSVSEADGGHDVRIGSEEFFIPDGKDGTDGETPEISVEPAEGGHNVRIGSASFFIPDGRNGTDGVSPTLEIGTVTTGEPGTAAKASVDPLGGGRYAVSMRIPKGADGTDGKDGADPRLIIGHVDTLPAGSDATADIEDVGAGDFILDLGIPKGADGTNGVTPDVSITASASSTYYGTPSVDVKKSGTQEARTFDLTFNGIKGYVSYSQLGYYTYVYTKGRSVVDAIITYGVSLSGSDSFLGELRQKGGLFFADVAVTVKKTEISNADVTYYCRSGLFNNDISTGFRIYFNVGNTSMLAPVIRLQHAIGLTGGVLDTSYAYIPLRGRVLVYPGSGKENSQLTNNLVYGDATGEALRLESVDGTVYDAGNISVRVFHSALSAGEGAAMIYM